MDAEALRLALEDLRERFRHPGAMSARMFQAPRRERVLQLPDVSAQALLALSSAGPPTTRTEAGSSNVADRVFSFHGQSQDLTAAFERSANCAGAVLCKVGPPETVLKLESARRPALLRWLWFVFDLALNDSLPSISTTRRLWRLFGAQGIPSHPWNVRDLEHLARLYDPNRRFPEGEEYWNERLRDHYCVEIVDLFIASAEATSVLMLHVEKSLGHETLDDRREAETHTSDQQQEPRAIHGVDFRSVHWFGQDYTFTAAQAACVRVLWEAWQQGTPQVGEQTILALAEVDTHQLRKLFPNHPALDTMIVRGSTKGTFRLAVPSLPGDFQESS